MQSYNSLNLFPDVQPLIGRLEDAGSAFHPVIFSNGTRDMLSATLSSLHADPSPQAQAPLFSNPERCVVVDEMPEGRKRFKPTRESYEYLLEQVGVGLGKPEDRSRVWLVSGNPFDVVGAKACGFRACWVDRKGAGWVDECVVGEAGRPDVVVRELGEVVGKISDFVK
jgi:2-haloacid dehalogenase